MESIKEKFEKEYGVWFMIDKKFNQMHIQDLDESERAALGIPPFAEGEERGGMKSVKLVKEITEEWIREKIVAYKEGGTSYKNLSKEFSKLIEGVDFYSATYGLGTHIALDSEEKVKDKIRPVLERLDENNVEYKLQFSDAFWVFRIILLTNKENLKRIQAMSKSKSSAPKMR